MPETKDREETRARRKRALESICTSLACLVEQATVEGAPAASQPSSSDEERRSPDRRQGPRRVADRETNAPAPIALQFRHREG